MQILLKNIGANDVPLKVRIPTKVIEPNDRIAGATLAGDNVEPEAGNELDFCLKSLPLTETNILDSDKFPYFLSMDRSAITTEDEWYCYVNGDTFTKQTINSVSGLIVNDVLGNNGIDFVRASIHNFSSTPVIVYVALRNDLTEEELNAVRVSHSVVDPNNDGKNYIVATLQPHPRTALGYDPEFNTTKLQSNEGVVFTFKSNFNIDEIFDDLFVLKINGVVYTLAQLTTNVSDGWQPTQLAINLGLRLIVVGPSDLMFISTTDGAFDLVIYTRYRMHDGASFEARHQSEDSGMLAAPVNRGAYKEQLIKDISNSLTWGVKSQQSKFNLIQQYTDALYSSTVRVVKPTISCVDAFEFVMLVALVGVFDLSIDGVVVLADSAVDEVLNYFVEENGFEPIDADRKANGQLATSNLSLVSERRISLIPKTVDSNVTVVQAEHTENPTAFVDEAGIFYCCLAKKEPLILAPDEARFRPAGGQMQAPPIIVIDGVEYPFTSPTTFENTLRDQGIEIQFVVDPTI